MQQQRPGVGVGLVVGAALLFAANGVVSKVALASGLPATQLVQLRTAGSAVVLMALALAIAPGGLRMTRRQAIALAVLGVVGVAMVQWLYFVAISRLPVGIALLLEYTAPLLVALWARFVFRERVRPRLWGALAACLVGLTMVAQVSRGESLDAVGVAAALAAAVALATYYLLGERLLGRRDPWSTLAWSTTFAALFWFIASPPWQIAPGVMTAELPLPETGATAPLWVYVAWVILLGTVAPYVAIVLGLRRLGAARAGLIGMLEPVAAAGFALLLLEEAMTTVQVLGGVVVLLGVALAETARRRPTPAGLAQASAAAGSTAPASAPPAHRAASSPDRE